MKQQHTKDLFAYWRTLYRESGVPERSQIEPSALRSLLGDTFILECREDNPAVYRLAGTRLCTLYASELKGEGFSGPWFKDDMETITNVIHSVGCDSVAAVFGSNAKTKRGRSISLETLVLPLLHNKHKNRRILGVTIPTSRPYWLGIDPVISQTISSLRIIDPKQDMGTVNARITVLKARNLPNAVRIPEGRRIGHLVVLEGGKTQSGDKTSPIN